MIIPVIMAGGIGSRLWPVSRKLLPKQFVTFDENASSLFQQSLERLAGLPDMGPAVVVCNGEHRFLVAEQLRELGMDMGENKAVIVLEPEGRNTAPAVALAALAARELSDAPQLLVLAADHLIDDVAAFHAAIEAGKAKAAHSKLVTFGIVPTEPHTGYGYIKKGEAGALDNVYKVDSFVEKPDAETAQTYLDSGDYLWNSGMFLFGAQNYLNELNTHAPDIAGPCSSSVEGAQTDLDFVRVDVEAFKQSAEDSVDYAVMEKTQNAAVIPLDAGWSDVGSWTSLWDIADKDADGNHASNCQAILEDTHNCMVMGELSSSPEETGRMITTLGVEDLVIVDTKDALLVANKNSIQDVKKIVAAVKKADGKHDEFHRVVYRPWGHYDSIDNGERHQVKRITVKPGEKLSVQMHHHRAEHWVVVAGTAVVTRDEETLTLSENESVYLPIGCVHALENRGKIPLELIEVQSGSYLGEDDIVRFEDRYGRGVK